MNPPQETQAENGSACAGTPAKFAAGANRFALSVALLQLALLPVVASERSFTFAVFGDNRGGASGELSPAFREIVNAVRKAGPRFVLNTGDMIYGHTNLAAVRRQWQSYHSALVPLRVPVHHVPGNHDIWDDDSASLYREFCGPTHWSFTHGSALFIGLDTESYGSRLGRQQFAWLKRQLAESGDRKIFVMFHRPLFPVDGALGSSLDAHPAERDELHRLFVEYRRKLEAVFLGHEHLYHFHERDGVPYCITGGAGANLYVAPELGGFHHFLLVHVTPGGVRIELKKVGAESSRLKRPLKVAPGSLLESWEQGLLWYPWDYTVNAKISEGNASQGKNALQLNFDLAQCPWPVLSLPLDWVPDWQLADRFAIDVYLPRVPGSDFTIRPAMEGTRKFAAPAVHLKAGWNTVQTSIDETWLPRAERSGVRSFEWGVSAKAAAHGKMSVLFDNFRLQSPTPYSLTRPKVLEGWERGLLWRVLDESALTGPEEQFATNGRRGLKLGFDFSKCREPVALARLNPPWDMRKSAALAVDIYLAEAVTGAVSASIGLRRLEVSRVSPASRLRQGWNKVRAELSGSWLPEDVRAAAEQVECRLSCSGADAAGWVVLDNLRAEK